MIERLFVFAKAQASSFFGGLVDYGVMIALTELLSVHYTRSIVVGGFVGAIVNFCINKWWTFKSSDKKYRHALWAQSLRFLLVVINSIVLKTAGTYWLTQYFHLDYKISRLMVDLVVSLAFNYLLQKHWVFIKTKRSDV